MRTSQGAVLAVVCWGAYGGISRPLVKLRSLGTPPLVRTEPREGLAPGLLPSGGAQAAIAAYESSRGEQQGRETLGVREVTPVRKRSGGGEPSYAREAMDLTVRLFSTRRVAQVQIDPEQGGATWCAGCAPVRSGVPVIVGASSTGKMTVNGRIARAPVKFAGAAKLATEDGRVAAAAGRWTVVAQTDGLHITVELPSERYVMAVLAAEAAPDEPAESLKALAVVARSFAMGNPRRHGLEGLCDSTHCQALRLGPVREAVRLAVATTSGETLWFGGPGGAGERARQVSGYFTESCGGMSEDASSLWGGSPEPWLTTHTDRFCSRSPAAWHAEIRLEQIRSALQAEGLNVPTTLRGVEVATRDASGRAAALVLRGDKGGVTKIPAATLRFALDRAFGWNELRSDLYRVRLVGDRVIFEGRGYGHGVGLCQSGARAMAAEGKSYREILGFYFPGTSVRVLAGDAGWTTQQERGWTLRTVADREPLTEVEAAGNRAWLEARAAFPSALQQASSPWVTVYPSTELFRQAASAPGWELAVTRGSAVMLQPLTVVRGAAASEGPGLPEARELAVERVLRHEFLHVRVETEAGPHTPLWLREGLVEVMAEDRCPTASLGRLSAASEGRGDRAAAAAGQVDAGSVEMALRAAHSWAASQRAHAAACRLVRRDVARFGAPTVRGWLRDGVPAGVLAGQ